MPLKVVLHGEFILNDNWLTEKKEWIEFYNDNRPAVIELLNEDVFAVIDDAGGIEKLLQSAEWVEEQGG